MENNTESYEGILWNKSDQLQKRLNEKTIYYQSSIKYFTEVYQEVERHMIQLTLINNEIILKKPTKLDELFNLFNETMKLYLENHKKIIKNIIHNIQKYLSSIKKENPLYIEFRQSFHNYQAEQKRFNLIKEKFHESALQAETNTLKKVQKKNEKKTNELIDLSKKLKKEVGNNLKKYQISLDEINKKREDYNSKQTSLIKYYVDTEKSELNMYYSVLNDFIKIELEKSLKYFNSEKIMNLKQKNKNKDIDKECQEILKKMKSNEKPDEKIIFEYKGNIDFDKCLENEEFDSYVETVDIIKKNFNSIYDGIALEKEKLKNNIRELIKRFYELDKKDKIDDFKQDEENLYFDYLNDPSTHTTFIKLLTRLRTNSKFNRHKKLIDILGKSFQIILREAEKTRNYWAAKNCIILSQTFYYDKEDKDKKKLKIYAYESIKTDSWLTKKDFWIGYTFWMAEEELKKFVKLFPYITLEDINNNKNFDKKINTKISDVLFSQLLPSITNMLEVTKKNMYAIEIIESFHEKYTYLTEEKMETLFSLIKAEKEEIDRMRNEYIVNKQRITLMENDGKKNDNINIKKDDNQNNIYYIKENNNTIINGNILKDNIIIGTIKKENNNIIIDNKNITNKINIEKNGNELVLNKNQSNSLRFINNESNKYLNENNSINDIEVLKRDNNSNNIINQKFNNIGKKDDKKEEDKKEEKKKEEDKKEEDKKEEDKKEEDKKESNDNNLGEEKQIEIKEEIGKKEESEKNENNLKEFIII